LRIGLIGCGAIGSIIYRAFLDGTIRGELVALYDIYPEKCRRLVESSKDLKPVICSDLECLLEKKPDLVIEAASQDAVREYALKILENGSDLMVMSVGALLDEKLYGEIERVCREKGVRVYVPSGAIAGVDGFRAGSLSGVERVLLITRKNPRSISRESLEKLGVKGEITRETILFEGPAEEAVRRLPFNINVAATLRLATRAPVIVRFVADPSVDRNIHEIVFESKASRIHVRVENVPHPENPKTSYIAALSAIELLKRLTGSGVFIGT
jgi:aspartate dehydrogenase